MRRAVVLVYLVQTCPEWHVALVSNKCRFFIGFGVLFIVFISRTLPCATVLRTFGQTRMAQWVSDSVSGPVRSQFKYRKKQIFVWRSGSLFI